MQDENRGFETLKMATREAEQTPDWLSRDQKKCRPSISTPGKAPRFSRTDWSYDDEP